MGQFKVFDRDAAEETKGGGQTRYYDMLMWGEVSTAPKQSIREKDGVRRCMFGVRWMKHKFCNCIVLEKKSPAAYEAASYLKMGDMVLAAGRLREYTYTPDKGKRKGEPIIGQDANITFLVAERAVASILDNMAEGALPAMEETVDGFNPSIDEEEPEW